MSTSIRTVFTAGQNMALSQLAVLTLIHSTNGMRLYKRDDLDVLIWLQGIGQIQINRKAAKL